jgi:hypothetical protein
VHFVGLRRIVALVVSELGNQLGEVLGITLMDRERSEEPTPDCY